MMLVIQLNVILKQINKKLVNIKTSLMMFFLFLQIFIRKYFNNAKI